MLYNEDEYRVQGGSYLKEWGTAVHEYLVSTFIFLPGPKRFTPHFHNNLQVKL